jgi:hypothetical protein
LGKLILKEEGETYLCEWRFDNPQYLFVSVFLSFSLSFSFEKEQIDLIVFIVVQWDWGDDNQRRKKISRRIQIGSSRWLWNQNLA